VDFWVDFDLEGRKEEWQELEAQIQQVKCRRSAQCYLAAKQRGSPSNGATPTSCTPENPT
jgi:hypothetical protein